MTDFEHWGHATQMLWKDTTSFACYTATCSPPGANPLHCNGNGQSYLKNVGCGNGGTEAYNVVCNYYPPGKTGPREAGVGVNADKFGWGRQLPVAVLQSPGPGVENGHGGNDRQWGSRPLKRRFRSSIPTLIARRGRYGSGTTSSRLQMAVLLRHLPPTSLSLFQREWWNCCFGGGNGAIYSCQRYFDLFHSGQVGWRRSFSASLDIWECIIGPDYALLSAAMLR